MNDRRPAVIPQRGFALPSVLWAAMILAAIAASIIATARSETRLTHFRYLTAQRRAIADGAINIALLQLAAASPESQPPVDGTFFTIGFAGDAVAMRAEDESGKIDLNEAQEALLRRLLVAVGVDALAAQSLTDKILDWREAGIGRRLNGAKIADYRDAGFAYGPRGGPFAAVAELRLVMGMTGALFDRIAPSLTVYSQTPWVDPQFAPPDVLAALLGRGAPAMAQALEARAAGRHGSVIPGHVFEIDAGFDAADGWQIARSAVVRLTGSRQMPFIVYRWQ
jgi:general secretion pathway protein K